ncbi:MAG: GSU2403 family nucleotidyltransferase fold protein, partial [Nitratireductor sp.]
DGQPLRFLDFLIHDEVRAVALHGDGILVNVPAPERFAIHKLLLSRLRLETAESQAKAEKDLRQAVELMDILIEQRPYELRDLWQEAWDRGPKWQQYLDEALDLTERRSALPPVKERLLALIAK